MTSRFAVMFWRGEDALRANLGICQTWDSYGRSTQLTCTRLTSTPTARSFVLVDVTGCPVLCRTACLAHNFAIFRSSGLIDLFRLAIEAFSIWFSNEVGFVELSTPNRVPSVLVALPWPMLVSPDTGVVEFEVPAPSWNRMRVTYCPVHTSKF